MGIYYCPNCNADLENQYGFDPSSGTWTCRECGQFLMDEDIADGDTYEGVAWFCDNCNALLNRQSGFSDSYGTWTCTECGHTNGTTDEDIIEEEHKCPNCGANLKKQWGYSKYSDDYTCSECGSDLHRNYSSDSFSVVSEEHKCPNCGANLLQQYGYSEYSNDWKCSECDAKLHRDNSYDEFSEVTTESNEKNDYFSNTPVVSVSIPTLFPNSTSGKWSNINSSAHQKLSEKEVRKKRIKAFF